MHIIHQTAIALRAEAIVREVELSILECQLDTILEYEEENELALTRIQLIKEVEQCEQHLFNVLEQLGAI